LKQKKEGEEGEEGGEHRESVRRVTERKGIDSVLFSCLQLL
jgi:hypothetical protein